MKQKIDEACTGKANGAVEIHTTVLLEVVQHMQSEARNRSRNYLYFIQNPKQLDHKANMQHKRTRKCDSESSCKVSQMLQRFKCWSMKS